MEPFNSKVTIYTLQINITSHAYTAIANLRVWPRCVLAYTFSFAWQFKIRQNMTLT